jgi:hypothetical protein
MEMNCQKQALSLLQRPLAEGHHSENVTQSTKTLEVLLTVHHGTLINQHKIDTFLLVCLLRVNASTCFGRYTSILRRLCTDAILCNNVRRMCVDCVQVAVQQKHTGS